jgi:hypothetical protein
MFACPVVWRTKYTCLNLRGRPESNASYFIMLSHDVRGRCWWYGSRGWTFPPIIFNSCCRSTDSSRGTVWQNGVWYESAYETEECHRIPPWGKEIASVDIHRRLLNGYGDQIVGGGRYVSAVTTMIWERGHFPGGPVSSRNEELLDQVIRANQHSPSTLIAK